MNSIDFMQAVAISAAVTTIGTEILKNKSIPIPAQVHPRIVAGVIAVLSSGWVVYNQHAASLPATLTDWASMAVVALIGSALAYNNILKQETSN